MNVASHTATIQGMTFDYSIGEMALISTEHQSKLIITQGLLQPSNASSSSAHASDPNSINQLLDYIKVFLTQHRV
ncbi:MAG: hypothetical protein R2831_10170 [Chitinophagaceae bacterium]